MVRTGLLILPRSLFAIQNSTRFQRHPEYIHSDIALPITPPLSCPVGCFHSILQMIDDGAGWDYQMANCCKQQPRLSLAHCILKNQRLHIPPPMTRMFPWNETLMAVSACSLLKRQSYRNRKQQTVLA